MTNQPGSPKYAIPKHVADIALKYCSEDRKTVSKGIQEMEKIIQQVEKKNE